MSGGTRPLGELPAGVRFRLRSLEITGEVVRPGASSVDVEIERSTKREFTTSEGERVSFETRRQRTNWSPSTEVEVLS